MPASYASDNDRRNTVLGWNSDYMVIDKSRGWLRAVELLLHIEPEAKPRRPVNFLHLWPGANSSTLMP